MGHFFLHQRYGRPQVFAGLLLLMFVAQCVWLIGRGTEQLQVQPAEFFRVQEGLAQWRGESVAGVPSLARGEIATSVPPDLAGNEDYDPNHSPLWYLVASAPLLLWEQTSLADSMRMWIWIERVPYLVFGVLLGASLWYVSRRLYGNAGGYIALGLYCFSPAMIHSSTLWMLPPEMSGAWSTFGAIFTAIAVAHTLYAPREVVLWNWRRILLLGLSLALAMGSQFSSIILLPLTLGFMLYLAPARRGAALAIWASACAFAFALLYASYFFHFFSRWNFLARNATREFPGLYLEVIWNSGSLPASPIPSGTRKPGAVAGIPSGIDRLFRRSTGALFRKHCAVIRVVAVPRARLRVTTLPGPGILATGCAISACVRGRRVG